MIRWSTEGTIPGPRRGPAAVTVLFLLTSTTGVIVSPMDLLKEVVYTPNETVRLLVCFQGQNAENPQLGASLVSAEEKLKIHSPLVPEVVSEFYFPTALLRGASPVFASMLDGPWKESEVKAIAINSFQPDAFRAFLDSLLHLANDTARSGDLQFFSPDVIRKVLPIAQYYQVDVLKQQIISTVLKGMQQCQNSKVTEPLFVTMANSLFAIEANIPEAEIPDWPEATLQQVVLFGVQHSVTDNGRQSWDKVEDTSFESKVTIKYKANGGFKDLSKKTLQRCFESLSLKVTQTLPKIPQAGKIPWPKISAVELSTS
jgi:hypothetical protein